MEKRAVAEPGAETAPNLVPLVTLAREAAAGDSLAMAKLLRTIAPKLVAVVKAILGAGHADVDDGIQQTLIGFVQGLPQFRGDCDPTGYGRVIAVRTAVAIRKRARARDAKADPGTDADAMPGKESPREDAFSARRKEALRSLLEELPTEQAEAFAMRVVLGFSLEEIARESGAPLNTVRSRLRLAKERLRSRIESDPVLRETLGGQS